MSKATVLAEAPATEIADRAGAEAALARLAAVEAERGKLQGRADAAAAKVATQFAEGLAALADEKAQLEEGLEGFARGHADELNADRHMDLAAGRLSLRDTPPKLETLEGVDWQQAAERIKAARRTRYYRVEIAVEKERVKQDAIAGKVTAAELKEFGLAITSGVVFKIKLAQGAAVAAGG